MVDAEKPKKRVGYKINFWNYENFRTSKRIFKFM